MEQKINVVGISCDDSGHFSVDAKKALNEAEVIFASDEQAALIRQHFPQIDLPISPYPSPISKLEKTVPSYQGKKVVMMALGDPLFYGIGAILLRFIPADRLHFHSTTSSLQAALCRFAIPWNDLTVMSLHGRECASLSPLQGTKGLYGVLTDKRNNPQRIAKKLLEMGHENALVRIAEALGRENEKLSSYRASTLAHTTESFLPLLVLIIDTR